MEGSAARSRRRPSGGLARVARPLGPRSATSRRPSLGPILALALCTSLVGATTPSARLDSFLQWFSSRGGRFHPAVAPEVGGSEDAPFVRVVTRARLPANSEVVHVPQTLLLVAAPSGDAFSPEEELALRLLDEVDRGEESDWAPYLAILPRQGTVINALQFGSLESEALRGTYAGTVVDHARAAGARFVSRARVRRPRATEDALLWALAIVQSRAFTVAKPSQPDHALHLRPFLAPGADFQNHSPTAAVGWRLGQTADAAFQIFVRQPLARVGLEVFNQYNSLGNAQLLAQFGFVPERNPDDFLPLSLAAPTAEEEEARQSSLDGGVRFPGSAVVRARAALLEACGFAEPTGTLAADGVPEALLVLARLLALAPSQLTDIALCRRAREHLNRTLDDWPECSKGAPAPEGGAGTASPLVTLASPSLLLRLQEHGDLLRTMFARADPVVESRALRALHDALLALLRRYPSATASDRSRLASLASTAAAAAGTPAVPLSSSAPAASRSRARARRSPRATKNPESRSAEASPPETAESAESSPTAAPTAAPALERAILLARVSEMQVLEGAAEWLHIHLSHLAAASGSASAPSPSPSATKSPAHGALTTAHEVRAEVHHAFAAASSLFYHAPSANPGTAGNATIVGPDSATVPADASGVVDEASSDAPQSPPTRTNQLRSGPRNESGRAP